MSYPWQHLDPKDAIIVQLSQWISEVDVHVLTRLYKPILNQQAYGLYMTLRSFAGYSLSQSKEHLLSSLLAQIDLGIPEFYQARIRLEALGLMEVYRSKETANLYLFELNKPLKAEEFFNDSILRTLLYEKVGSSSFEELKNEFASIKKKKKEFENITKSFLEVFQFNVEQKMAADDLFSGANSEKQEKISVSRSAVKESDFDWGFFKTGMNKHFIDLSSLTDRIKEMITTYHLIYGIDELAMQRYVLESADVETGKINQVKLGQILQKFVRNSLRNPVQPEDKVEPFIQQKKDETTLLSYHLKQKGYSEIEIAIIDAANTNTPGEYIKSIKDQKNGFVSDREAWTIKDLVEQSNLPTPVINMIIHYSLISLNNPTFDKNFALKIANDWAQKGVDTPEKALDAVKELYAEKQRKREKAAESGNRSYSGKQKTIRKETMPKWADQEINPEGEKIDPEKEKMLREQLKRIRENKT